jgi:glucose-1-phosphate cytidylyltransferase
MKAVILAGGEGTRLWEETRSCPKPMIPIGDQPILWHIMQIYSAHGIRDFVICLGRLGNVVRDYFRDYRLYNSDVTVHTASGHIEYHSAPAHDWTVTLVDTGVGATTGERLVRIRPWLAQDDAFCMTYGDGVADIDIGSLVRFHRAHGLLATVTTVRPLARFGVPDVDAGRVVRIREKPMPEQGWINGGFYVLQPAALDYIGGPVMWEDGPLQALAAEGQLAAYEHVGYWQCLDTWKDKKNLERDWETGHPPWKVWSG